MSASIAESRTAQVLADAMARHRAGDLQQAERGYREVLAKQPDDAWATYLLAVAMLQQVGPRLGEATNLLQRFVDADGAEPATVQSIPDLLDGIVPVDRIVGIQLAAAAVNSVISRSDAPLARHSAKLERLLEQALKTHVDAARHAELVPDDRTRFLHELFSAMGRGGEGVFFGDCMASVNKSQGFLADPKFVAAFERNARHSTEENGRAWRLHTLAWAAQHALELDGDFVECGVFEGFMSATLCDYLDFADSGRTFYLYDTFEGFSAKYSSPADFGIHHGFYRVAQEAYGRPGLYETVVARFQAYPNVKVIRGVVPDVLLEQMPERIAYCHIDLNSPAAEVGALEVLFDRIVPGGMVVFDDYGWLPFAKQMQAEDAFAARRGYRILELPTGQGLIVKR